MNNEYIELLAETGILGLTFIIIMLVMLFVHSMESHPQNDQPIVARSDDCISCSHDRYSGAV